MKTLVVYYSNTGSNRYLAEQLAHTLKADCEQIRPRPGAVFFLMMLSVRAMYEFRSEAAIF